jgi:hypothetical protein
MANLVEFVLQLKDFLSPGMRSAAANANSSIASVTQQAAAAQQHLNGLGSAGASGLGQVATQAAAAQQHVSGLAQAVGGLNRQMTDAARSGGLLKNVLSGGLAVMVGNLGTQGLNALVSGAGNVLASGREAGMTLQDFKTQAGAVQGQQIYDQLNRFVADSIYGKEQFGIAQMLLSYGDKNAVRDIRMAGDIAGADTQREESIVRALGQVISKGHLAGGEQMQFTEAGFNPLREISIMTGKSMDDLTKEMEQSRISSDLVRQAFEHATGPGGQFYNRLNNLNETPGGKLQQLEGNVSIAIQDFGKKTEGAQLRFLAAMEPVINRLPDLFNELAPGLERAIDGFTSLMPSIVAFGGALMNDLRPLGDLITSPGVHDLTASMLDLTTHVLELARGPMSELSRVAAGIAQHLSYFTEVVDAGVQGLNSFFARFGISTDFKDMLYNGLVNIAIPGGGGAADALAGMHQLLKGKGNYTGKLALDDLAGMFGKGSDSGPKMLADMLGARGASTASSAALTESSDAVIGGGKRSITFNFNHELVRQIINTSGAADTFNEGLRAFEESLLRVSTIIAEGI